MQIFLETMVSIFYFFKQVFLEGFIPDPMHADHRDEEEGDDDDIIPLDPPNQANYGYDEDDDDDVEEIQQIDDEDEEEENSDNEEMEEVLNLLVFNMHLISSKCLIPMKVILKWIITRMIVKILEMTKEMVFNLLSEK